MQLSVNDPKYTPADVQELFELSPGMFNSYRMRDQVPSTVVKAGRLNYSRFTLVQLAQLGVQFELVRQFSFSHEDAKRLAAQAAIEFQQALARPLGEELERMPYVIVKSDPPRWFRARLDATFAEIDIEAGNLPWLVFDPSDVLLKVFEYAIRKSGLWADYQKFEKRQKAGRN